MYAAQLADVARACRTGAEPVASSAVGRTALAIVERAYATARG
jgi:predicted dehydrogenase